ncbi:STAS domain-containing protein [Parasphingorhabdus pacifica]
MNFEELFDDSTTEPAPATSRGTPPGEGPFRLRVHRPHREKAVITVAGPLDLATTARFTEILHARLRATTRALVLDLSGVTFLGAAAIEELLHADRHARTTGQHLTLITDTHAVDRPLQALDLTTRFTYADQPVSERAQTAAPARPRTPHPPPATLETVPAEVSSRTAPTG